MRLLHLADLHIGKRVNEFSMLEDQEHILIRILNIAKEEKPDAVLISGDVYDKSVPAAEAVSLFDDFLTRLAEPGAPIFIIGGNHDSQERLSFGAGLLKNSRVYLAPAYSGSVQPIELNDEYGKLSVYMLPFIKPSSVRCAFPEEPIDTYNDGVQTALRHISVDGRRRNVLLAHQFVTGAAGCESEERSVGGLDNVDAAAFEPFDYVALGHMHGPQSVGRPTVRYAGSPLKYSFSEAGHSKSVTLVNIKEKGNVEISAIPLIPKRDLREIRGLYNDLVSKAYYDCLNTLDYYHITLLDEEDVMDAVAKLRVIYKNLMKLDYDNARTRKNRNVEGPEALENKSPLVLLNEFYELQNNQPMSREQLSFSKEIMETIWEGEI
jgi:DNA repair protein SbcD/Mre11